jgi:hypothetical protein
LAALLVPALASAKARVLRAKCISNQRQIGMALKVYAMFPSAVDGGSQRLADHDHICNLLTIRATAYRNSAWPLLK